MRGATGSAVRFLFRDAQSTAGRTGEVGTAVVVDADEEVGADEEAGADEEVAAAVPELDAGLIGVDEAIGVVGADEEAGADEEVAAAVPELDAGLIGVDEAIGVVGAGQAPGTMFRMGLVSPMIRMVMSSLVLRSAEIPPPVRLRWRSLLLTLS